MYGIFTFVWLKLYAKCKGYVGKYSSPIRRIWAPFTKMRSAWGRLVVFKPPVFYPKHPSTKHQRRFGMVQDPPKHAVIKHRSPQEVGKNWMSRVWWWFMKSHQKKQMRIMRIWKKWRSCIIVHNVRWKQKTKITLPPTKLLARPSSQNKIIDLLFCHSHSSLWPLTVTLWPADPCAFFCFGREVCLDVLGQMINPCGFFSSLMAEVRGDCPREVGRFKSEISKYFLGLHKMLEKK